MSEKLYALLFRLYPSRFRGAYREEAIQLFRDRSREERGLLPALRLWADLLADLIVSLPREYRYTRTPVGASSPQSLEGVPSFYLLEDGAPRLGAFLFGGVLSLAVVTTVLTLINQPGGKQTRRTSGAPTRMRSSSSRSATAQNAEVPKQESVAHSAGPPPVQQRKPQNPVGESGQRTTKLDAGERRRLIDRAIANLKQYYFDRDVAQKTADAMLVHEKAGDDTEPIEGRAFAELLTAQMRDASGDGHLIIEYSRILLPKGPRAQTVDRLESLHKAMVQQNCMVRKLQILPHNIGYLKLDFFPNTSLCGPTVRTAMASLNHADAIIFDLRDNSGGFPDMVSLIASYLFDHPEYMYSPRGAPTKDSWTRSPVPGNGLADKPVYVLTSAATWSGAEQFSYDLKMLKRATLVGETTRGGAHAGAFHRIDDHFGMGIPEEKPINPFSNTDWEGVGVEPDVKVEAANALETSVKLAEARLQKK
jgi:Peptidase family S41